ncbi:MAG: hypothetical protein KDA68_04690 [Planctomycetaceae bacterium]|nr:hypothetical protein [Planctomycetaceae bacterium]
MIQFNCDCGQKLKVDDKYAGKKIRCPKCKAVALVPPDGDLSDVMSAPLGDMKSPESEEFDFKTLPKLKSLDDLVDLEDVADDDEDEEGGAAAPPPPATSKVSMILGVLLALIGLGGAVGSGMVLIPSALAGSKATVGIPKDFEIYSAIGGISFSMKYPKGWKIETGGGTGGVQPWVKISGSGCTIDYRISVGGGAIGGYGVNIAPDKMNEQEPVHKIHEFMKEKMVAEDPSYDESSPEFVKTGFGSTRISKYSRTSFFGGEYGYRVTAFAGENWNGKGYCSSLSKFEKYEGLIREILLSISLVNLEEEKPANAPAAPAPDAEAAAPATPGE